MLLSVVMLLVALTACDSSGDAPPPDMTYAASVPADPALAAVYRQTCMGCHASGLGKAPVTGDQAAWQTRAEQGADVLLTHTINGYGGMPPLGSCADCDLQEFEQLIAFMLAPSAYIESTESVSTSAESNESTESVTTAAPAITSQVELNQIYATCAGCHSVGAGGAPRIGDGAEWQQRMQKGMSQVIENVRNGVGAMPAGQLFCPTCTDDDFKLLVQNMLAGVTP